MNKFVSIILLSSIVSTHLFAVERSYTDAKNVALNLANKLQPNVHFKIDDSVIDKSFRAKKLGNISKEKAYQIIKLKPRGWVIVSNDDMAKPILGYNLKKKFTNENISPAFIIWANGIDNEIKVKKSNRSKKSLKLSGESNGLYKSKWDKLSQDPSIYKENRLYTKSGVVSAEKLPIMSDIQWGQWSPYNRYTPNNNLVGCSATAMVQIMAYHKWPTRGWGSYSYTHPEYGVIKEDFDNFYNWYGMGDLDKALISYHVGVTMNMNYSASVSTAWPSTERMRIHFGYKMSNFEEKVSFTDAQWDAKIQSSLDNNRPIWYTGFTDVSGHAFVLDGYRYDETSKMYHVNFGWTGSSDGWYALSSLNGFSENNSAIFDIRPNGEPHYGRTPQVSIYNPETKRYLLSAGSVVSSPELGWLKSPAVVGADANYYDRGTWTMIPHGDGYRIKNIDTKRYLFSKGSETNFNESGWSKKTPRIVGTDIDYYGIGQWKLERIGKYNNTFKIQNIATGRYLFQSGKKVTKSEGGWLNSPDVLGLGSYSNFYHRASWQIMFK